MTGWWVRIDNERPDHPKWSSLSGDAYKFADKLLCWAARRETAFIPLGTVVSLAGDNPRRAKALLAELCEGAAEAAGTEFGILERTERGFLVHDAEQYWPPNARDSRGSAEELSAKRAAAGRAGGTQSAQKRRATQGTAQPPKQPSKQNTGPPEASPKQTPEATSKQTEANGWFSPQTPLSGRNTDNGKSGEVVVSLQCFPRAQGQRPRIKPPLLAVKKSTQECTPSEDFERYASDLGLTSTEYADVVVDWRSKCDGPQTLERLASMLCRFIEQKAKKSGRLAAESPSPSADTIDPTDNSGSWVALARQCPQSYGFDSVEDLEAELAAQGPNPPR